MIIWERSKCENIKILSKRQGYGVDKFEAKVGVQKVTDGVYISVVMP